MTPKIGEYWKTKLDTIVLVIDVSNSDVSFILKSVAYFFRDSDVMKKDIFSFVRDYEIEETNALHSIEVKINHIKRNL